MGTAMLKQMLMKVEKQVEIHKVMILWSSLGLVKVNLNSLNSLHLVWS